MTFMVEMIKSKVLLYHDNGDIKRFTLQRWYANKASMKEDYVIYKGETWFRGISIPCIILPDMNSVYNTIDRFMKVLVLK